MRKSDSFDRQKWQKYHHLTRFSEQNRNEKRVTMEHERAGSSGGDGKTSEAAETQVDCAVSMYARAAPTGVGKRRQEAVRDRLTALADEGRVSTVDVERWPGRVTVDETEAPRVADTYEEFAAAADAVGARLEPFFGDRSGVSGLLQDGTGDRVLTLPVIALTVRQNGEIVGLYPCYRDGIHHRVEECVEALEGGQLPANLL
jgi:hypothetical protein